MFVLIGLSLALPGLAMDRWAALSMLESGDNDKAIGPGGEISRFQIQSVLWPGGDPKDAEAAKSAAQKIMKARLEEFSQSYKRPATDFEFYILWNAPSYLSAKATKPIPAKVADRARRYANLVQYGEEPSTTNSTVTAVKSGG